METGQARISIIGRVAALALAIATVFSIAIAAAPTTAFAADSPAIALGTDALEAGNNTGDAQVVYYGVGTGTGETYESMKWTDPYSWYVIGYDGVGAAALSSAITLFATDNLGSTKFNDDSTHLDNVYAESLLQDRIGYIEDSLTLLERAALLPRTLATGKFAKYSSSKPADYHEPFCDGVAIEAVNDAVMWPLSTQEAWDVDEKMIKDKGDTWSYEGTVRNAKRMPAELSDSNACNWWLRSPGQNDKSAATTTGHGDVLAGGGSIDNVRGVRPAFHLKIDAVLFVSAAKGGKPESTGSLSEVGTNDTGEWKLTLLDSSRSFAVNEATAEGQVGGSLDLAYTGASVGVNEYVSAIIVDGDGNVIRYGKLAQATDANGTVTVPIPSDLAAGTYSLKVFEEECNGDCETDYASPLSDVSLTVEDEAAEYTITFVNYDDAVLQSGKVAKDETPEYEGAEPTKPATTEHSYTFNGWSPAIVPATENTTYKATYTEGPVTATLTFDLAGGELDGETGTITVVANVGETINLLEAPTRDGYTFKYWKGSEYAAGAEYKVEGDHEFAAEWEQKSAIAATGDDTGLLALTLSTSALASLALLTTCLLRRRES